MQFGTVLLLCGASFVVLAALLWTDRRRVEKDILSTPPPNAKVNYLKASWPKTSKSKRRFPNHVWFAPPARPKFGVRLSFEVFGHASLNRQIFVASAPPVGRRIEKAYLFRGSRSAPPQKKPRAKAQTFQIVVKTSFRLKTENAGIWSGLALFLQGGAL